MLRTKVEVQQHVTDMKTLAATQQRKNDELQVQMESTISDAKFWLDKYSKAYKENDAKIGEMQGEFNGRFDSLLFELTRRVSVDDFRRNFDKLNDILFIKFSQVEDMKAAQRDMINYQKHFYPLQM